MFMRYISHEMRTPLNTVLLGLSYVKKRLHKLLGASPDQECYSAIKDTQLSCEIAVNILDDMLLYDKVEGGLLKLELRSISPWLFIEDSIKPFFIQVSLLITYILVFFHSTITLGKGVGCEYCHRNEDTKLLLHGSS